MSRRKNGTNRAAAMLGLSMYGPMNTGRRKLPKGASNLLRSKNENGMNTMRKGGKINEGE